MKRPRSVRRRLRFREGDTAVMCQQHKVVRWTCVGSVDCLRLRTVRGKESIATNKPCLPTGISPRSYPAG